MARPTKEAAQATQRLAANPNFSVSGYGTGFDFYTNFLPELYGADLVRDMFLMADTDETVGAMLYAIAATMRQIEWKYTPQIDGKDAPDDPEARKWSDLMTTMIKDMDRPFDDHIEDLLSMLWAGFAPVEMIFKRRDGVESRFDDGYYGIGALNLIDQTSIWDFIYEGGKPIAMKQMGMGIISDGKIPLSKTLLYRTSSAYNNPRGRPLLKNAWRVWRLKRKVQDSEAIGIERELVGLPIFEMPLEDMMKQFDTESDGTTLTEDAKRARAMVDAAKKSTQDMRLNKTGGLVIPSDPWGDEMQGSGAGVKKYGFRIQTTGGQRTVDSRTVARDYDHAITRVAMMQFLTLGQRSGGSYGLSEDQSSMAVSSIMAWADKATAEWNKKAVALTWIVNAFPAKYRPRLTHSDVNKNGIVQLGQFLAGIGKAVDLWGGDATMRRGIAIAANLPYDSDAQDGAAGLHTKKAEEDAKPQPAPVAANDPAAPRAAPKAATAPEDEDED